MVAAAYWELRHTCGRKPRGRCLHLERGVAESLPAFIQNWKGDGVLCRLENDETAAAVQSLGLPSVDLRGVYRLSGGAVFDTDPVGVARLAADHLLDRGFRNFAFCGFRRIGFSEQRSAALVELFGRARHQASDLRFIESAWKNALMRRRRKCTARCMFSS